MYGLIERAEVARAQDLLPIGLSQRAELVRDVREGSILTYQDVALPESFVRRVRREQDSGE